MIALVIWSAILALAIAASFLFSGTETGMYAVNRIRLRARAEKGFAAADRVLRLLHEPTLLIAVILVGNNLANYFAASACRHVLQSALGTDAVAWWWNTLLLSPFLFVFGEITPKDCFRRRADTWVPAVSAIFGPLVRVASRLRRAVGGAFGLPGRPRPRPSGIATRREIELSFQESAEEGALSGDQGRLAANILAMRETRLDSVARPLGEMAFVAANGRVKDAVAAAAPESAARVLVIREDDGDIRGQLILHELVGVPSAAALETHVRSLIRLPGDMTAMRALLKMRTERQGLALVLTGSAPLGVVTMQDLAEEVVGELPGW